MPTKKTTIFWNEHAKNFSISSGHLLEQNECVDVTLVTDGHLFSGHRLILASLSPYFRCFETTDNIQSIDLEIELNI